MTIVNVTSEVITNLYLYGSQNTPEPKSNEILIRDENATVTITVDAAAHMAGPGRFALGGENPLVKAFFNDNSLAAGTYTKEDLRAEYAMGYIGTRVDHKELADGTDDYIERVYVWNNSAYAISSVAQFIVTPTGENRRPGRRHHLRRDRRHDRRR